MSSVVSRLGWDLIKGLAYFNVALEVQDENTEVGEYRGTEGWTAPEMGTEGRPKPMYSPIKADRWSCGRVLLRHIIVGGRALVADKRLWKFAHQLKANDPQQRPSLLEWHNFVSSSSGVADVGKDGRKEVSRSRQDMAEVDTPKAKKARLEQRWPNS